MARVAIIDYGMGNLFSVKQACEHAGLDAVITSDAKEVLNSHAVILPGVGAFGDAIQMLTRLGMVDALHKSISAGKMVMGICLGMQLLMTESHEFGKHAGLDVIKGSVVRFDNDSGNGKTFKVPQVGWNRIYKSADGSWNNSCLRDIKDGAYMYFVHSFYVKPEKKDIVISTTKYGSVEFCSSLKHENIFACQFHPERSGPEGLRIYGNLATQVNAK